MADSRLDVLSTLLRGAAIDGGAQSQRTLRAIAAHRAREPHHVLLHGWALLQRPERLGDDGACALCVETFRRRENNLYETFELVRTYRLPVGTFVFSVSTCMHIM